jgi:hypothetical protein
MKKFEKVMSVINKYSLLVGGISSFYNSYFSTESKWEMVAWACAAMFALSGFAQIVELERKIKDKDFE